jgi:hypothetical protein
MSSPRILLDHGTRLVEMEHWGTAGRFSPDSPLPGFVASAGMIAAGNRHRLEFVAEWVGFEPDSISVRL